MSEFSPSQHQPEIDRDGGLYDQAVAEDYDRFIESGKQRLWDRMHRDNHLEEAYADNAKFDQDVAYATYEGNIQYTRQREAYEAYQAEREEREKNDAELEKLKKELKREKRSRAFGRIAAGASMVPGIASVADLIQEGVATSKNNKRRRNNYKQKNGTMFGNKSKGYSSTFGSKIKSATGRDSEGKKQDHIIQDIMMRIEEKEQNKRQRSQDY